MNHHHTLHRLIAKISVMIALSAIVGWGCGSGEMGQVVGADAWNGETSSIVIDAGVGMEGQPPTVSSVSKDIGAAGGADAEGGIDSPTEAMTLTCDITYDAATPIYSVPVVPLIEENAGAGDYSWEHSCGAVGASLNKCIACRTIRTGGGTHCTAHCEGMVPYDQKFENDRVDMHIRFDTDLTTLGTLDPADTVFLQVGERTEGSSPWTEADSSIDSILDPLNPLPNYDLSSCDGGDGEMALTLDDLLSADPLNADHLDSAASFPRTWRKNFTVTSMGDGTCSVGTLIDTYVPLTGVAGPSHRADITRDDIVLGSTFCDTISGCVPIGGGGVWYADLLQVSDEFGANVFNGSADVAISQLTGTYAEPMNVVQINADNIFLEPLDPLAGQGDLLNAVAFDATPANAFYLEPENAFDFQLQDLVFTVINQVTSENEMQNQEVVWYLTSGCGLSDNFWVFSRDCWDPAISFNSDPDAQTLTTWDELLNDPLDVPPGEHALEFDEASAMLKYRDADKTDDALQVVKVFKEVSVGSGFQVEAHVLNVDGFDTGGDAYGPDYFAVELVDADISGYAFGVMSVPTAVPGEYQQSCVGIYMEMGAVTSGAFMDCSGYSDFYFRMTYSSTSVTAEVSLDGGQNYVDISSVGAVFPGAGNIVIQRQAMSETNYAGFVFKSADDGAVKDDRVDVDFVRWHGITSATQFRDTPYVEQSVPSGPQLDAVDILFLDKATSVDFDHTPMPKMVTFSLDFSEDMNQVATESAISLADTDGNQVPLSFAWSRSDPSLVNVSYTLNLEEGTNYTLRVSTAALSMGGENLAVAFEDSFTTMTKCDYNGDGVPDVAVGALLADNTVDGLVDAGKVYVYSGADLTSNALTTADAMATINGVRTNANMYIHACLGDVDADGYADFGVSDFYAPGGGTERGQVYVFRGQSLNSNTLSPADADFTITHTADTAYLGLGLTSARDMNRDGYDDILVSAPGVVVDSWGNPVAGVVYTFSGNTLSSLGSLTEANWQSQIVGSQTPAVPGIFGFSLASIEDMDADGYPELFIGRAGPPDSMYDTVGGGYLYLGLTGLYQRQTEADARVTITGVQTDATAVDRFGMSVAGAGDVNGDGTPDIIVGASGAYAWVGAAYIFSGAAMLADADGQLLASDAPYSITGDYIAHPNDPSQLGMSVSGVGDIVGDYQNNDFNGDGLDDVIVGAYRYRIDPLNVGGGTNAGGAFLFSGAELAPNLMPDDATMRFGYYNKSYSYTGASVSGAGDVNGDGYPDVMVSALLTGAGVGGGEAYLFSGAEIANPEAQIPYTEPPYVSESKVMLVYDGDSQYDDSFATVKGDTNLDYFGYDVSGASP